ncbi:MAG: metallophosphoesterase [Gemmatimonadaceae bacterium]|nr:metallophosphoesterase [Gemmatimonadaceae bacterium]
MRILQVSDIHFGPPAVAAHHEAVSARIASGRYDAIAIAGDLTQRNFRGQFVEAQAFVRRAREAAPTIVVPGNHDVAWWWNVCGIGLRWAMYRGYRRYIADELEPVLKLDACTIVGLNSCHGIQSYTLTSRLRDLSVVGAVTTEQWMHARAVLKNTPQGALRILMLHHNIVPGDLSHRWGLADRGLGLDEAIDAGADLVMCGHDHQGKVAEIERHGRRIIVSQTSTISDRMRGGTPASFHEIEIAPREIKVNVFEWEASSRDYRLHAERGFAR